MDLEKFFLFAGVACRKALWAILWEGGSGVVVNFAGPLLCTSSGSLVVMWVWSKTCFPQSSTRFTMTLCSRLCSSSVLTSYLSHQNIPSPQMPPGLSWPCYVGCLYPQKIFAGGRLCLQPKREQSWPPLQRVELHGFGFQRQHHVSASPSYTSF